VQTVAGNQTCVDVNECLQPSPGPCLNGACTNITNGGGYSCVCNPGFVELNGNGPTPTCVHPNSCGTASSDLACVTAQMGNTCVDNPPPAIGFNCQCNNPAYVRSVDGRSCIDKNDCDINHCTDGGDTRADCTDLKAPKSGYSCDCSPGFAFDGATCSDIDECSGGPNPCGAHGSCSNAKGGYSCTCDSGYALASVNNAAVCVSKSNTAISYTVSTGSGCSVGGAGELPAAALLMVALAMLLLRRRRAR
jgi:MYXO-CTERM domain-containing protein